MTITSTTQQPIVAWIGRIGAAGAAEVSVRFSLSASSARARLVACERAGLLEGARLLHGQPPLYAATPAGLRAAGLAELRPCRVSPSGFAHLREVARAAAALERSLPDLVVVGERELRVWERQRRSPAGKRRPRSGRRRRLCPPPSRPRPLAGRSPGQHARAPAVAIEVELTVKSPPRLAAIVRGWARSRLVAGVVYYASPPAARALRRAVATSRRRHRPPARARRGRPAARSARRVPRPAHRALTSFRSLEPGSDPGSTPAEGPTSFRSLVRVGARAPRRLSTVPSQAGVPFAGRLPSTQEVKLVSAVHDQPRRPARQPHQATPSFAPSPPARPSAGCGWPAIPAGATPTPETGTRSPNYFDVTVFGASGEACGTFLEKGRPVAVDGRLEWHDWETADGQRRQTVEIIADSVQFLGGPRSAADTSVSPAAPQDAEKDDEALVF